MDFLDSSPVIGADGTINVAGNKKNNKTFFDYNLDAINQMEQLNGNTI